MRVTSSREGPGHRPGRSSFWSSFGNDGWRQGSVTTALRAPLTPPSAARRTHRNPSSPTIVRCSKGHLFTTIWIPGASFKSVRLGMSRYQHCPVGHHWALVTPVKDAELGEDDKRLAAEHHDVRIP